MKKLFAYVLATVITAASYAQNAPIYLYGSGLDGSIYQKTAIYSDATYGLLFEAPYTASNTKLPIELNWRGGGPPGLKILPNGNAGMGITSPSQGLQVVNTNPNGSFGTFSTSGGQGLTVNPNITNGMVSVYSDYLGSSAEPKLHLATYTNHSTSNGLTIDLTGNVGIGTTNPDQKLSVAGTIHAQAVKVDMTGWSDYVFKPAYNLSPLENVKTYIDKNHHLPDMPSEKEVVKQGIDVGEMLKLQQKKIEELTLYLIEKDKQLSSYENRLKQLERKFRK